MLQTIELTARDAKLKAAVERKHFIMRSHAHKNMSEEDMNAELPGLQKIIDDKVLVVLAQCKDHLQSQATVIKKEIPIDGDMKGAVASLLITILKDIFLDEEIQRYNATRI